jgi:hypothetical protein
MLIYFDKLLPTFVQFLVDFFPISPTFLPMTIGIVKDGLGYPWSHTARRHGAPFISPLVLTRKKSPPKEVRDVYGDCWGKRNHSHNLDFRASDVVSVNKLLKS